MSITRTMLAPAAFFAGLHADRQVRTFLKAHTRCRNIQDKVLGHLLHAHRNTGFGRDHGFSKIRSYEEFKLAVPVGSYETLRPYVQRVLRGQTSALLPSGRKVIMFSMTSGTTGEPKHIPVTENFATKMRRGWNIFGMRMLQDHSGAWLRPILTISSPMRESTSPTGLPCGAISGLFAAKQNGIVRRMYVVPPEVPRIKDPIAKYYTMLRCGIDKDVAVITTANPSSTIKLIETGQAHTERLIRDIADGTLSPPGQIAPEISRTLRFRPNKALARRIDECLRRDGILLPRHFWNVSVLTNWTGGTLKLYLPRLRELFGDVPIRDIGLLASEGRFSIPLSDGTPAGVAEITSNFLEFIPAESHDAPDPPTLRADEVEIGREYFIVISNWASLWRYDIDDRVRIVDFHHQTPVFEFLSRGSHTANITGEKITEHQVVEAMGLAGRKAHIPVERFILQGRFAKTPYYELRLENGNSSTSAKLAELFDEALCELNMEYASKRKSGRLGPVQPVVLPDGELERAEIQIISQHRGRSEQYKHQYLMTEVLEDK